ncbi:hypothetical protein M426DRAFT_260087 [Hypoxylon sp. CI-4A]|nr:hypothetical protein M426DRAFT_260087 [Hypoxylon sp. CI-4A]
MPSQDIINGGDLNDFSCYITINNMSDEDFGLSDYGIVGSYGQWPEGQPLNTVEAHTSPTVHLKDPKIIGGSEGWVEYEVLVGEQIETFRLEFSDPESPWSSNYLRAKASNPELVIISIDSYKKSGHPFYAFNSALAPDTRAVTDTSVASRHSPFRAKYDIGFEGATEPLVNKSPVHESIAIAAFIQSKKPMPKATNYHNLNSKQWEYIRGLVWNDDPSCYLFDDYTKYNHVFTTGYQWYMDFKFGNPSCMIQRSHFGNLQFLHGMAASDGEEPGETQRKILRWFEVMYKLACGNQGVSEKDQLKQHLGEWFNNSTQPSDSNTLRDLLLASTPSYYLTDIKQRALGHCLHIISDSYAVGHVQRRLKNPESYQGRNDSGYMTFKSGAYGDWGAIITFHSYGGQDSHRHAHYDGLEDKPLPVPKKLDSFNSIIGARNAIENCKTLINYFAGGTKWEDGVQSFLEKEVFPLDEQARPSNSQVDEADPATFLKSRIVPKCDPGYQIGFEKKLVDLETGGHSRVTLRMKPVWRRILVTILMFIVAIVLTVVSAQVTKRYYTR